MLVINILKPTGHVTHHQFNIQQLYALPTLYYVFCIYPRTNSDLCHLQHKLIGFYNRDEVFTARYGLGLQLERFALPWQRKSPNTQMYRSHR